MRRALAGLIPFVLGVALEISGYQNTGLAIFLIVATAVGGVYWLVTEPSFISFYRGLGRMTSLALFILAGALIGALTGLAGWFFYETASPQPITKAPQPPFQIPEDPETARTPAPGVNVETSPARNNPITNPNPPSIAQTGQNNIAQIGNNNQAIINPKPIPRRLTDIQKERMLSVLSPHQLKVGVESVLGNAESDQYARDFVEVFREAKWDLGGPRGYASWMFSVSPIGISVHVKSEADLQNSSTLMIVASALLAANIDFGGVVKYGGRNTLQDGEVLLTIGVLPE
jgi:hypothetical protein